MRWLAILLVTCLSLGCNQPPETSKLQTLPSGKTVRIYSIKKVVFGDNSHPPSFVLRYETEYPVEDSPALRAEALEVWELLRPVSDQANDTYAAIMANEPIRGVLSKTRSFTYGFTKENGHWTRNNPTNK